VKRGQRKKEPGGKKPRSAEGKREEKGRKNGDKGSHTYGIYQKSFFRKHHL
jgi:hypothetical protein